MLGLKFFQLRMVHRVLSSELAPSNPPICSFQHKQGLYA